MNEDLKGRLAVVTGSSRGIGRSIAIALAEAGADVAINYRSHADEAREVSMRIQGLGRRCVAVRGDLAIPSDVLQLVQRVHTELGMPDILVNNAGIAVTKDLEKITSQDWEESIAVNLTSAFLLTQSFLPGMRNKQWGRIICISSVAAQIGGVVGPHYAASKAGLIGLMHFYASHFASQGITANTIAPGPVRSAMSARLPALDETGIPVGRFGKPEEVASVVVAVATNGYITGQTINVNGGRYMT